MDSYLHAYWRMDYVQRPQSEKKLDSPFKVALAENDDEKNLILLRGVYSFVIMNRFPYNAGHLLILPNREVADIDDLTHEEQIDLWDNIILSKNVLQKELHPQGFNIGWNLGTAAGAGVAKHLHAHVVPRWDGDTNFMPVIAHTKVLPQALESLYKKLRPAFKERYASRSSSKASYVS